MNLFGSFPLSIGPEKNADSKKCQIQTAQFIVTFSDVAGCRSIDVFATAQPFIGPLFATNAPESFFFIVNWEYISQTIALMLISRWLW